MTVKKLGKAVGNAVQGYIKSTDRWLWLLCIILSGVSVFFLTVLYLPGDSTMSRPVTQIAASLIGIFLALIISIIDYRSLIQLWRIYVPILIIVVISTLFIGVERGSNQAWLSIPIMGRSLSLQPAEFLKISFITTFALHLNHVKEHLNRLSTVLLLGLHGAAHVFIIILQNDSGTALVFLGIFIIMIFSAGISWKYIALSAGILIPAIPLVWSKFMSMDQKMRFLVLLDPSISERYSFQQMQGLKALGVGGVTGAGISAKQVFVPESYNDFIFTFIGETAGFIGSLAVMILLLLLFFRLIYNSRTSTSTTGSMICSGMAAMILIQTILNIGMCINILPVIGVTLPFLSAGGSSVVALYMGIGFVLSVYSHKDSRLFGKNR